MRASIFEHQFKWSECWTTTASPTCACIQMSWIGNLMQSLSIGTQTFRPTCFRTKRSKRYQHHLTYCVSVLTTCQNVHIQKKFTEVAGPAFWPRVPNSSPKIMNTYWYKLDSLNPLPGSRSAKTKSTFFEWVFCHTKIRKYHYVTWYSLTLMKRFSKILVIKVSKIQELHSCMSKYFISHIKRSDFQNLFSYLLRPPPLRQNHLQRQRSCD